MPWVLTSSHETPVFTRLCILKGLRDKGPEKLGMSYDALKYVEGKIYRDAVVHSQYIEYLRKHWEQDPTFFIRQLDDIYAEGRSLIDTVRVISQRALTSLSQLDLIAAFDEFVDAFEEMTAYLIAPLGVAPILEAMLQNEVKQHGGTAELLQAYMLAMTAPTRLTRFGHFHQETLQLALSLYKDKESRDILIADAEIVEIEQRLKKHNSSLFDRISLLTAKFGWLNLKYCFGYPFTFEDMLVRLRWLVRTDPGKKADDLEQQRRNIQLRFGEAINALHLSPDLVAVSLLEQDYAYLRHWRYEDLSLTGIYARPLLEEVARRIGLAYLDICCLSPNEIRQFLTEGSVADEEVYDTIRERRSGYVAVMERGQISLVSGEEVIPYRESTQITTAVREIEGVVASQGFATGPVKVIRGKADFYKMEEGDILVVTMTTPDYLRVMDKSVAIVADAGGLTSHTAIVSRELGIPCIVGTRFATDVLTDGEIIEVDARQGKVLRVLKK